MNILLSVFTALTIQAQVADFDTGKSTPNQSLFNRINIEQLSSEQIALVLIEAHADKRGGREYNMRLTEARALGVKRALEARGVTAKIVTVAKGKTEQLEGASLEANRRVVITSFNKEKVIAKCEECKRKRNIISGYVVRSRVGLESDVQNLNGEVRTRFGEGVGVMYQREILDSIWLGGGIDTNNGKQISIGFGF